VALDRYDEAVDLLSGAIEKDPDNVSLYTRRGRLYIDVNRPDDALRDLLRAVTDTDALRDQYHWYVHVVYSWLGHLYETFYNDADSALKYYSLSLEDNGEFASSLASVGDIHFYSGDFEEAIRWYDKAVKFGSGEPGYFLCRANALAAAGRKGDARADYRRALKAYKSDPENACRFSHFGECYLGLGNTKKAVSNFEIAIKEAQNCADCPQRLCHEAYFGLCLYYTGAGELAKARECLDAALKSANAVRYNRFKEQLEAK